MSAEENYIEMEGVVDAICRDKFTVIISGEGDNPLTVICTVSGKIRVSGVKILVGDLCRVMVSAHDPTKGRIVYRLKA